MPTEAHVRIGMSSNRKEQLRRSAERKGITHPAIHARQIIYAALDAEQQEEDSDD